jgi:hypothetical protein
LKKAAIEKLLQKGKDYNKYCKQGKQRLVNGLATEAEKATRYNDTN